MHTRPDTATLRALAVRYQCDPRTIAKAIDGRPVRGMARDRAAAAAAAWRATQTFDAPAGAKPVGRH